MWNEVINLFREYMGTGLIIIWFLVSVVYLLLTEKRKPVRILFVYVPILLLLIYFNPLFARVVYDVVGEDIYYRILWLMPVAVVLAFAIVDVLNRLQGKQKVAFGAVATVFVIISGSYIYNNPYFQRAENLYHVPQKVVDICDAIVVEGREVKAVFPEEMLQYVRQYSPVICMPYGREILVSKWAQKHEMYSIMEAEEVDAELLVELCRENWCHYIILKEDKKIKGDFADYDFNIFDRMHGYVIYKDSTVDLTYFLEE